MEDNETQPTSTLEVTTNGDDKIMESHLMDNQYSVKIISLKTKIIYGILSLIWFIMFILCISIPITGQFWVFTIFAMVLSVNTTVKYFVCKSGVCCKYSNANVNKILDVMSLIVTLMWIFVFVIACLCQFCNLFSGVPYNKWEVILPFIPTCTCLGILLHKLWFRYNNELIPIKHEMTPYYIYITSINIHKGFNCYIIIHIAYLVGLFVLAIMQLQNTLQASYFLYNASKDVKLIETQNYGSFEYECFGDVEPSEAQIRIINVGGAQSLYYGWGWYNELFVNEYSNISICDYNRGGFGFTPSKVFGDKTIETEAEHLIEIADAIFGYNKTFHINCHSRGGLISIQTKLKYYDRIESIAMFDTVLNTWLLNDPTYDIVWWSSFSNRLVFMCYSMIASSIPSKRTSNVIENSVQSEMYKKQESGKSYSFRNYIWTQIIFEWDYLPSGTDKTQELYDNIIKINPNFTLGNEWIIFCRDHKAWEYNATQKALYAISTHSSCVYDKTIANKVFYYPNYGLKTFYDNIL